MGSTSKVSLLLAAVMMTAGCGKKEETAPAPAAAPPVTTPSVSCVTGEILAIDGDGTEAVTLMELEGDAPRIRIRRNGNFGKPGDKFRYCSKD